MSTTLLAQKGTAPTWLVGTWKINTGNGFIVEQWKVINDTTLQGKSMFVKAAGDSTLQESLVLSYRKGEWNYTSTVVGQNNNLPVSFKIIFMGRTEFISENRSHDFPQRIAYRRIKNNLFASIEGSINEKYAKRNFDFVIE
jgi:hypothetical protein